MTCKLIFIIMLLSGYVLTEVYQLKIDFMKLHCRTSSCNKIYISAHERTPPFNPIKMFTIDKRSFYNRTHKLMDIDIMPAGEIQGRNNCIIYNTMDNKFKILNLYVNISINEIYVNITVPKYCKKYCYVMITPPYTTGTISTIPPLTVATKSATKRMDNSRPYVGKFIFHVERGDHGLHLAMLIIFILFSVCSYLYMSHHGGIINCMLKFYRKKLYNIRKGYISQQTKEEAETTL